MPTTTTKRTAKDMTAAWAGRDKAAAQRKLDRAIAEILSQGYATVILTTHDGRARTYNATH